MAIETIKMRKIARELQEWIYLGINEGMIQSSNEFIRLRNTDQIQADSHLKRSIDMPYRAKIRIEEFCKTYGEKYINECLAIYGDVTLDELLAEIDKMIVYSEERVKEYINTAIDNAVIAEKIRAEIPSNIEEWTFKIPADYKDIFTKESKEVKAK
jgi:hypothetical protein